MAYLSNNGFIYTANKDFQQDTFDPDIVLSGENSKNNVFYLSAALLKTLQTIATEQINLSLFLNALSIVS